MTERLPGFNPVDLMMKRKQAQDDLESGELPEVTQYDPKDVKEIEDFCAKMGIVGFNFRGMSPKAALAMLRGQCGMPSDVIASMEAMGHRVAGKDYPKDKQLLNG